MDGLGRGLALVKMSEDASEPYKRRKVESPLPADEPEQWLEDFQRNNLASRLEVRNEELKRVEHQLAQTRAEKDGLEARLTSIQSTWTQVSSS